MRYSDGGGLSAVGRAAREKVRLHAAQMFEQDVRPVQVARRLRGGHEVGISAGVFVAGQDSPGRCSAGFDSRKELGNPRIR
jgi:hypothetical protein